MCSTFPIVTEEVRMLLFFVQYFLSVKEIKNVKIFRNTVGKISLLGSYRIWRSQDGSPGDLIQL